MDALARVRAAIADRYAIDRVIGRGGMATVYLARDLRHDRHVAIKVLNEELGAVLGVERFLAEIKVTANLHHPNLLPLFDSGEANGLLYYVMPYVEGESLRERLQREKQLPVDEAIRIAAAIGSALDYAHRHGVIHRDLKPENVLLHEGQPVIADFGIALAVRNAGGNRLTQTGMSMGTPQYMSPEQATGDRVIDGRTDIYSLGAILYEMLVGDPPHLAGTAQGVIAKVLTERPRSIRASRPAVPPYIEAAVDRALEKLPADRFPTAQAMVDALGGKGAATVSAAGTRDASTATRVKRAAPWILAIAAAAVAGWAYLRPVPIRNPAVLSLGLPDSVALVQLPSRVIDVSADGALIAYVGTRNARGEDLLFLRSLDDPVPRPIAGTEGAACAVFTPDGQSVSFWQRTARQIARVPIAGGTPVVIADSANGCGVWGDRGSLVYERTSGGIWMLSPSGVARLVARPDSARGQLRLLAPEVLPGERWVIATVLGTGNLQIVRIDLKNGRAEPMGIEGLGVRYSATGHLLYSTADASVMVAPFSSRSARLTGPPVQLRGGLSIREGSAPFAVSAEGTLVGLFGGLARRRLAAVDLHGATRFLSDEERLFAWPAVSPDGQRVAMEIADSFGGPWDVWVLDLRSSTLSRLTHGGTGIRPAGWTSDGRKVVFIGLRTANDLFASTPRVIVAAPWGGGQSGKLDTLFRGNVMEASIGGRYLVASVGVIGHTNLWLAPLDTPSAGRMLSGSQANESSPEVSPDGRWLTYASDESGRWEVYVTPLPGPGGRVQASANGGVQPRWGRDGESLFYRDAEHLLRATLATSPELRVVKRETLFEDHFFRGNTATSAYDAFPGGHELVMLSLTSSHAQVTVLMNWPAMLERRSAR